MRGGASGPRPLAPSLDSIIRLRVWWRGCQRGDSGKDHWHPLDNCIKNLVLLIFVFVAFVCVSAASDILSPLSFLIFFHDL